MTDRELKDKVYKYNVRMTDLAKKAANEIGTEGMQSSLEHISLLMSSDFEGETVEMPVDVIRQLALFSSVTMSRLLVERYKNGRDN